MESNVRHDQPLCQLITSQAAWALPGVFDTLSAKIAEQTGFALAFISGYSVAATAIGEPDMGLLTQTELIERARAICRSVHIPILVDADTGYGNPLNVHRTVTELIAAGAAGCFLEDQVWPKRCGHMQGKQVVSRAEYLEKIHAAVDARGDAAFYIVARTDALAVQGMDEAIARVTNARQIGADASFVEAPRSHEELAQIGRRSPAPNVANMIRGGRTPLLGRDALLSLGFHLILHPLCGLFAAARAMNSVYRELKEEGEIRMEQPSMTFGEFNALIGAEERMAQERRYQTR